MQKNTSLREGSALTNRKSYNTFLKTQIDIKRCNTTSSTRQWTLTLFYLTLFHSFCYLVFKVFNILCKNAIQYIFLFNKRFKHQLLNI